MSQVTHIDDMMEDSDLDQATGLREIANCYDGRTVLLTGGAGFLGRLLIERILRSFQNVSTLFLLLRPKKGKTADQRFKELFDDVIFDRLKREKPQFARKLVLIEGDMAQVGLGLSSEQRELLRSTNIVIHGAATVRFDEKLRNAAIINVRGTEELILLAKEMVNLKAFVHISTAYSNCVHKVIQEKFYPPPIDSEKLLSLLDTLDDASLDHLTPVLLGKWPNTYSFSKAVAEDSIRRNCQGLPVCIVRPSIVTCTAKEPIGGWINNFYGATGILIGAGIGVLRTAYSDGNLVADMIPADYVINNIIAAAWDVAIDRGMNMNSQDSSTIPNVEDPRIYNAVSSCQRPITWTQVMKYSREPTIRYPSMQTVGYFSFRINKYRWVHNLHVIFLHLIPAAIIDSVAWLTGRKPMLWKTYMKIENFSSAIQFFMLNQWRFSNDNFLRLWGRMSLADRNEFDLDMGSLDWENYCDQQVRGLRVYVMKDPLDTLDQARARYAKLKIAHYTLVTAACGVFLWLLWTCLRWSGFL